MFRYCAKINDYEAFMLKALSKILITILKVPLALFLTERYCYFWHSLNLNEELPHIQA